VESFTNSRFITFFSSRERGFEIVLYTKIVFALEEAPFSTSDTFKYISCQVSCDGDNLI